jgi:hypothetical protein
MTSRTKNRLSDDMRDAYRELAKTLDCTPFKGRGAIREAFEELYGVSKHTVYRGLEAIGWSSGKKKRSDAGTTSVDEKTLATFNGLTQQSFRATGKVVMKTTTAKSILLGSGLDVDVSPSRLNQLRRQRKTTAVNQLCKGAHQRMRSLYPNHVHQVDPSYCLLYYPPGKKGLRVQKIVDESEVYANKPEAAEKLKNLKCWRYVLTDHYSSTIIVRYFESAGETSANLWLFLLYCWQTLDSRAFRGVPDIMVWDKGSANISGPTKNALDALSVDHIAHETKRAWAKGQVECANNIVETQFESRLKFEPVNSVEELNAAVESWYNAWNANLIDGQDCRLNRRGMSEPKVRNDLWQTILRMPEKLRELPPIEVCKNLLRNEPKSRKVTGYLEVSFKHPAAKNALIYSVKHLAGIAIGDKVMVSPLYYGNCQIMVTVNSYTDEDQHHILEPMPFDEAGFPLEAPVWGEEIKGMPDTLEVVKQKEADAIAYPGKTQEEIKKAKNKQVTPFEGKLNAHSHLKDIKQPEFMKRTGSTIELPGQFTPAPREAISRIALKKLVIAALGRSLEQFEMDILANYENVFDEDVTTIVEQLQKTLSPLALKNSVITALGRDLDASEYDAIAQYQAVTIEDIPSIVHELQHAKPSILKLVNS